MRRKQAQAVKNCQCAVFAERKSFVRELVSAISLERGDNERIPRLGRQRVALPWEEEYMWS
jgi:hypothetical protein